MDARRRRTLTRLSTLFLAVIAGCGSEPEARPVHLEPGATYHSRPDNFTVAVPPLLGPGVRESETADDDAEAGVTFDDDFGTLLDVQSTRLSDDRRPAYAGGGRGAALADDFTARVLPALRRRSPGATVLHQDDAVETAVGPALFAVVGLPGGSTRTVDGTHPDAVRGVLVFPRFRWLYAVQVQQWPPTPNAPVLTPDQRDARLLDDLRQAVAEMTFN